MRPTCILISDSRCEIFPGVAAQLAMLRGLLCWRFDLAAGGLAHVRFGQGTLFAMSYSTLRSLDLSGLRRLKTQIEGGNTLYVRGGFESGQLCSFAPFAPGQFEVAPKARASGYQFAGHDLVPTVLRNEQVAADVVLPGALCAPGAAEVLAVGRHGGKRELPFIFALACGAGFVIYDLLPDEVPLGEDTPVVDRLSDAATRCWDVGALIAANRASGRDPASICAYNLTLDDRPRNFDHLNAARIRKWLAHIDSCCPGAHVDFAWTPIDTHPGAAYIRSISEFNTGFAWHGLWRHCDHREIGDFAGEYAKGEKLVRGICRRYGVKFQPVMIFPYLRVNLDSLRFVAQAGFAGALRELEPAVQDLPSFMRRSTPFDDLYVNRFPALRRCEGDQFTRQVMLGNAALDLPIITGAHPSEIGLQRWSALYNPKYRPSIPFSHVAAFAREKHLVARSLEEIAAETVRYRSPVTRAPDYQEHRVEVDVAV
jgi:hypothetical protein